LKVICSLPVGPVPRSPELNLLDFSAWGYAKSLVYTTDVTTPEEMQHRIVDAFQQMKNDPGLLERILGSLMLSSAWPAF
ncbi:hypothetical protein ANN_00007, partial [Periplaneta americana]